MREDCRMGHYDIGEWADYVRNLLSGARRSDLDQHLAGGCEECSAVVGFLREVSNTAATDRFYQQASAGLATGACEIFSGYPRNLARRGVLDTLRALVGQLTFDSASQLYPSGARGAHTNTRQLMYQAGGYCVDLRVDR